MIQELLITISQLLKKQSKSVFLLFLKKAEMVDFSLQLSKKESYEASRSYNCDPVKIK